jgi:2-oxo-4-hydroxy-4-carboxy--5-ureidoimidazoline (OHCU) decarboxylase
MNDRRMQNKFLGSKRGLRVRLTTSPPSVSRWPRQREIPNISQPSVSTAGQGDRFAFSYADDVRTSLETHIFTACYRESFAFPYADDVRTSLEAHAFTACYGESFAFPYADDVRTSLEAHAFTACYEDSFGFML